MISILLIFGLGSAPASAQFVDSFARHKGGDLGRPANCDATLKRRADRLEDLALDYPEEGHAFRRAFKWTRVAVNGVAQLLGVPRRQQENPSFFVVIPLKPEPQTPAMILNVRPSAGEIGVLLQLELTKLNANLHGVINQFPHVEHGIRYERGSLDVVFFEAAHQDVVNLGQAMNLATTLARELYMNNANLVVEIAKQHDFLGRAFRDGFAWTVKDDGDGGHVYLGRPSEPELADYLAVEVERNADNKDIDLRLIIHPETAAEYIEMSEAFGAVQIQKNRWFDVQWILPERPKLRLVGTPEPFGKMSAIFPGKVPPGHANLKDGLEVTVETLKRLRRLRIETDEI